MTAPTRRLRVLNIFSDLPYSRMYELVAAHVDRQRIDFNVMLLNPPSATMCPLERALRAMSVPTEVWPFRGRADYIPTLIRLVRHLRRERFDVVHTHLRWAYYVGMPAAFLARMPVRVLTRHHATEHHHDHPHMVKFDRLANRLATHVIVNSAVTHRIVTEWERVPPEKVTRLPLPLDVDQFRSPRENDVALLRARYNPERRFPVIGVMSRFTEAKGVQYIVPAFARLLTTYPDALLLMFGAAGPYQDEILRALESVPSRNYALVTFEPMAAPLFRVFDVFVHVPTDAFAESAGGVYSEALCAGVPSIFTLAGVAADMVEHLKHCYVVPFRDADAIHAGLRQLIDDRGLAKRLGDAAPTAVPDDFRPDAHARALESLYETWHSAARQGRSAATEAPAR